MSRKFKTAALWIAALALAVGGGVWYLLSENDLAWYLGGAAALPLLLLVARREERVSREKGEQPGPGYGGLGDGPWGPPD